MFTDYTTTMALVADRQARLHHEAQQHHLARRARRARRTWGTSRANREQAPGTVDALPQRARVTNGRAAA